MLKRGKLEENMKAGIFISGGISGNFKIKNAITCFDIEKGSFNSFFCNFETMKEAKKALKDAFKYMKNNDLDVELSSDKTTLYYDASTARIQRK